MTKKTLPVKTGEPQAAETEKKEYRIHPGVAWVNGKRIGDAKTISLTAAEAVYDLGLDRVAPADKPEPASWAKKPSSKGEHPNG